MGSVKLAVVGHGTFVKVDDVVDWDGTGRTGQLIGGRLDRDRGLAGTKEPNSMR